MEFRVYVDRKRLYRWRLVAGNGLTVADSGQGYTTAGECRAAIRRVRWGALLAAVSRAPEAQ